MLAHSALGKKNIVKNATAYTWDRYCHLVVDRASLIGYFAEKPLSHIKILAKRITITFPQILLL
jgi:hypothetical protein